MNQYILLCQTYKKLVFNWNGRTAAVGHLRAGMSLGILGATADYMYPFKRKALLTYLAALGVLLDVGCKNSSLAERKREHAKEYAALSGEEKTSVDRGDLRVGMTTNAVLIAWGPPSVTSSISTPKGPYVFWEYYRKRVVTQAQEPQIMVPRSPTPVPQSRVFPETTASSTRVNEFLERTAVFHDERLVSWEPR